MPVRRGAAPLPPITSWWQRWEPTTPICATTVRGSSSSPPGDLTESRQADRGGLCGSGGRRPRPGLCRHGGRHRPRADRVDPASRSSGSAAREAVGALVRNPASASASCRTCHGATWARSGAIHPRPWGGTGNVFPAWDFNRGFVAAVGASATVVADKDCPLPRLTPIEHLSPTGPRPHRRADRAMAGQIRSLTATHLELVTTTPSPSPSAATSRPWSPGRATSLGLARPTTLRSSPHPR